MPITPTTFHSTHNNASSQLTTAHVSGDGVLVLASAAKFGSPSAGSPSKVCVTVAGQVIIFKITGISGNTLTVAGTEEGTADTNLPVGTIVSENVTAGHLSEAYTAINAMESVLAGFVPTVMNKTRYVDPSVGNDSTATVGRSDFPYATVSAALNASSAGDLVQCSPGTHAIGAGRLTVPLGVTLAGCGMFATTLTFDGSVPLSGGSPHCCIEPTEGNGWSMVRDLKVSVAYSSPTLCGPIGLTPNSNGNYTKQYLYLDRVFVDAATDCLYWKNTSGTMFARGCILRSQWDIVYASGTSTCSMYLTDCDLYFSPDTSVVSNTGGWGQCQTSSSLYLTNVNLYIGDAGTGSTSGVSQTSWYGFNNLTSGTIRLSGFRVYRRSSFTNWMPVFAHGIGLGSPGTNSLILDGGNVVDWSDYCGTAAALNAPPRLIPLQPTWLKFTIAASSSGNPYWSPSTAPSAGTTTYAWNLLTVSPNCIVHSAYIRKNTNVSGTGITAATIEVGPSNSTTKYVAATSVFSGSASTGTPTNTAYMEVTSGTPIHTATGLVIQATLRTTGGNVSAITAGSIDIYLLVSCPSP